MTRISVTPELTTARNLKPGDLFINGDLIEAWEASVENTPDGDGDTSFVHFPRMSLCLKDPIGDDNASGIVTVFHVSVVGGN